MLFQKKKKKRNQINQKDSLTGFYHCGTNLTRQFSQESNKLVAANTM